MLALAWITKTDDNDTPLELLDVRQGQVVDRTDALRDRAVEAAFRAFEDAKRPGTPLSALALADRNLTAAVDAFDARQRQRP